MISGGGQGNRIPDSSASNACHPDPEPREGEGSAVVFLCFTVKVGEAKTPNPRRLGGDRPKSNRRSFVPFAAQSSG